MTRRNPPARWVLPAIVDPPRRRCFIIEVPDEPQHIAAFRGALLDLGSAYKWGNDTAHTARQVAAVWREVIALMRNCDTRPPQSVGTDGGSEFMIRQNPDNPCILESSLDGVTWCAWADLSLCLGNPPQPGAGAEQPAPNGGQACYNGELQAAFSWLLPTLVNTGDTLSLQSVTGAGADGGGFWYCPDGLHFIAGNCLSGTATTSGGDPLPSAAHMRLLWKIAGVYYDAMGGAITVPSGVAGQQVELVVNDSAPSNNSGVYRFTACVINNQAGTWESLSDFSLSPYGWTPYTCAGDCGNACNAGIAGVYGSGLWTSSFFSCSNQYWAIITSVSFAARTVNNVEVLANAASAIPSDGFGSGLYIQYHDGTGWHTTTPSVGLASGDNDLTIAINVPNVDQIRVITNSQSSTVVSKIKKVTIRGQGTQPPELP